MIGKLVGNILSPRLKPIEPDINIHEYSLTEYEY